MPSAALAAKLVYPNRPAVAVCGDGGFGIALNGMMTARDENIPIVVVVFNNSMLGWVLHGQGARPIASKFADYDHAAIGRAMGCDGIRVERATDLPDAIGQAHRVRPSDHRRRGDLWDPTFRDVQTPSRPVSVVRQMPPAVEMGTNSPCAALRQSRSGRWSGSAPRLDR